MCQSEFEKMAEARKNHRGCALLRGESQRKSDFSYIYTDSFGRCRYIYAKELKNLREKENKLVK